jgi:hypothetical protein
VSCPADVLLRGTRSAHLRWERRQSSIDASQPAQGLFGKGFIFGPIVDGWAVPDDPAKLFPEGR